VNSWNALSHNRARRRSPSWSAATVRWCWPFATYYPFFPYQVHLIPEIVKTLRSKGGRGEQMSGSTRTLLAITQDILRAGRRKYLDEGLGALVSFDELYNNLSGEGEISPDVRTELSRIKETVPSATGNTTQVPRQLPRATVSERNRNVLCLVEIEMSAGQSFRFPRNPRRQG